MNPHSYRLKVRDFVHQGKIEIDVNERAVFIRTQGCFFVYTNSDCFLNSLMKPLYPFPLSLSSHLIIVFLPSQRILFLHIESRTPSKMKSGKIFIIYYDFFTVSDPAPAVLPVLQISVSIAFHMYFAAKREPSGDACCPSL